MGKEIDKYEIKITELSDIMEWIHRAVWKVSPRLESEDVIISIPDYFIDVLIFQNEQISGMRFNKEKYTLFGCKVQPAYENKITVFDKHRFYTKEDYLQLQLNTKL